MKDDGHRLRSIKEAYVSDRTKLLYSFEKKNHCKNKIKFFIIRTIYLGRVKLHTNIVLLKVICQF